MEGSSPPFHLQEAEDDETREKIQNLMNRDDSAECGQDPSEGLDTIDSDKRFHLPDADVDASKSDNLFICSLCNQTFESSDLIQIHMQSHTNAACHTVLTCDGEISIKKEMETENEISSTKRKYRCTLCPKIFYSKYNLDVHIRTHTGERPYECSMCGKCFGSSSNCRKHMKTHKVKDRNEIKEDVDFMNYVRVLSGDRPFECITCSKSYTCKSDAQKHLRVHTGRKPYNCSLCIKTFSCSSNLYTHMRRKHRESAITSPVDALGASSSEVEEIKTEKIYRCIECNMSFETKSECENHMIVRHSSNEDLNLTLKGSSSSKRNKNGYKCTVCKKTFLCFDGLLEHMTDHQRESLFMCSECGETFTRNKDLVCHMRLHNFEHPVTRHPSENCPTDSSGSSSSRGVVSGKHVEEPEPGTDGRESKSREKDRRKIENLSTTNKINEQSDDALSFNGDNSNDSDLMKQPTSTAPLTDDYTSVKTKREDSVNHHKSKKVDTSFLKTPVKMEVEDSLSSEIPKQSETFPTGPNVYFQPKNLLGKIKTEIKSDVPEKDEKEKMADVKACYRCLFCCEAFTCHSDLNEHVKLHAGDGACQCPLCRNGFCCSSNIQGVMRRVKGENGGEGFSDDVDSRYECAMCEVTFQSRKPYIEHMRVHTKEKSFICYICGKNFSRMKNLRQHFVGHTGERAFSCTECGKSFIRKVNLKNHMRIHTGEQPHKCSLCLKAYNSKYDLDTHMRSHTGEKPCPCPDCGKSFASNGHLHKHMKTHAVGEESEYRCSVCYKNFFDNTTLRRHFMIHTGDCPYECTVCGKSFRRDIRLKYHMRIHTGDQPYKCSVCLKDCNSKYQMETHMRTHTGEKPFQCSVCDKSFQSKGSLNKHETIHLEDN